MCQFEELKGTSYSAPVKQKNFCNFVFNMILDYYESAVYSIEKPKISEKQKPKKLELQSAKPR